LSIHTCPTMLNKITNLNSLGNGEATLRHVDSSLTLPNPQYPAPQSFRNCSTERLRKTRMRKMYEGAQTTGRFLSHELDTAWMGAVIVTCFFTSGLIDSVAFNSWNCFVGMQTGQCPSRPHAPSADINRQYRFRSPRHWRSATSFALPTMVQIPSLHWLLLPRHPLLQRSPSMAKGLVQPTYLSPKMDLVCQLPDPDPPNRHRRYPGLT
jgi:hypothetical protein